MKIYSRFDKPISKGITFNPDNSLTFQSMKDESDINLIIKQYKETGTLPNSKPKAFSTRYPMFGDFSTVTDYSDAVNLVNASKEAFDSLPSAVRKKFNNNPMELVTFLENAENREEAENLGLIEKSSKIISAVKPAENQAVKNSADLAVGTVENGKK